MTRTLRISIFIVMAAFCFIATKVSPGSILETKHNLSITGPGPIKSTTEEEVCIFCHTPHNASRDIPYLWNRSDTTENYIHYQSSTIYAAVGQPTGASKLCLSCHDGTVALGAVISRPEEIPFSGGIRFMPEGITKLGTDISDDHPVSFVYDSNLVVSNPELIDPSVLPPQVKLDKNKELQCTACHDHHNDSYGKFLVMPNQYSGLCATCHEKDGWLMSSHSTSGKQWNGQGSNPWPHTSYTSVSENGCENCHMPHTAGGHERILNYAIEEDNCLVCHNGNVASMNIENELIKPYGHFVQNYAGIHNPVEDFTSGSVQKHVECVDCHNPHQSNSNPSPGAPLVSGAIMGIKGIDASGLPVKYAQNSFEICFKCHGDTTNFISALPVTRQIDQLNARLEFNPANPSFHPVEVQGVNPDVPSLLPPYTASSLIFCTDCHNNDASAGPKGPHSSNNKYLLERNYTTADNTTENSYAYELCYKCHSRISILDDQSFKEHKKHIVDEKTPCSACHDPHGISYTQGNPANNSHLINFDLTIVQPDRMGRLYFEKQGTFSGQCFLTCHGKMHEPKGY